MSFWLTIKKFKHEEMMDYEDESLDNEIEGVVEDDGLDCESM